MLGEIPPWHFLLRSARYLLPSGRRLTWNSRAWELPLLASRFYFKWGCCFHIARVDHPVTTTFGPQAIPESSTLLSPLEWRARTCTCMGLALRKENLAALDQGGSEYNQEGISPWAAVRPVLSEVHTGCPCPWDILPYYDFSTCGSNITAIWCCCLLTILTSFVGTSLLFSMCFQWAAIPGVPSLVLTWAPDRGGAKPSATSPLASALAPGAAKVEAASVLWLHWDGICRSPRDRLIRLFHSFSNSCNHNARFYSYSSCSYMNVDSSVALMGADPWSWCSSPSDRVRLQRVCKHEQKTTSKDQNVMTFLLP